MFISPKHARNQDSASSDVSEIDLSPSYKNIPASVILIPNKGNWQGGADKEVLRDNLQQCRIDGVGATAGRGAKTSGRMKKKEKRLERRGKGCILYVTIVKKHTIQYSNIARRNPS